MINDHSQKIIFYEWAEKNRYVLSLNKAFPVIIYSLILLLYNFSIILNYQQNNQGPVVQSIVSLTSSLLVKMLTVLVSKISNSQEFLLKNVSCFCKCNSYSHFFFSKNISVYAIFNDQSFNDTLTNDIVSFEQLDPDL